MAEDVVGTAYGLRGRLRASFLAPLLSYNRLTTLGLPLAFAAATFAIYWFLGPRGTLFINHVNQANAFLHGRLDLVPELSGVISEPAIKDGHLYMQHPPGPALLLLPGVAIFGLDLNQTLASVVVAALTAPLIYRVVRTQVQSLSAQVWFTVLFLFGTIYWFTASNGGVWFFSHTVAVFFIFGAIYATLVPRHALLTGLCLGAAYLSRPATIMSLPFFLIMLTDVWLRPARPGAPLLKRLNDEPLLELAAGLGAFLIFSFAFNYARFDNPLDSGYFYGEQVHQEELSWLYSDGVFNLAYIPRHVPPLLELMPVLQTGGPFVLPSALGTAIWVTTPAFFCALFARVTDRLVVRAGVVLLAASALFMFSRSVADIWDLEWGDFDPLGVHLLPFWWLIAVAIATAWQLRDRFILACWAAIIPTALTIFTFAATGWTQFGYRYALDFYPFLFLLTIRAISDDLKWHHKALIGTSVLVNLWGVLWNYQFDAHHFLGVSWVAF